MYVLLGLLLLSARLVSAQGEVRLEESGGLDYVGFKAPISISSDLLWQLPSLAGSQAQCLATDGSGVLSWRSAGTGDFKADGSVPMTGTLKASVGTAGAPSITFNADQDTGLFRDSAMGLAISTSGTERMRMNSSGYVGIGTTTPAAKLTVSGAAQIGNSSIACTNATKGSMRYDNGGDQLEFCNGSLWSRLGVAACGDVTPTTFSFTDLTDVSISTLTESSILQLSGFDCEVVTTISGDGNPAYRICTTSNCSAVKQDWTTGPSLIDSGEYLQLRLSSKAQGGRESSVTFIAGTAATFWRVTTESDCSGSPAPGTVCPDGTVYAGISPDGFVKMYAQRCDFGQFWDGKLCRGAALMQSWTSGTGATVITGYSSGVTGKANSAGLAALSNADSPYLAAQACENLVDSGHSDWYLPASNEMQVISDNQIQENDLGSPWYWTSSETDHYINGITQANYMFFSGGYHTGGGKTSPRYIRCVRR